MLHAENERAWYLIKNHVHDVFRRKDFIACGQVQGQLTSEYPLSIRSYIGHKHLRATSPYTSVACLSVTEVGSMYMCTTAHSPMAVFGLGYVVYVPPLC